MKSATESAATLAEDSGANDYQYQLERFIATRIVDALLEALAIASRR
jgi:hypothetical protein